MPLAVAAGSGRPIPYPPGAITVHSLRIQIESQRPHEYWCWAACCIMVFRHFGIKNEKTGQEFTKCELARDEFGHDCCVAPDSTVCNCGAWPEDTYSRNGVGHNSDSPGPSSSVLKTLSLSEIKEQIDDGSPVEILYRWAGENGGAHVALVTGWYEDGDLEILDPWFGPEVKVSYDYVLSARRMGRWEGSYYRFQKR